MDLLKRVPVTEEVKQLITALLKHYSKHQLGRKLGYLGNPGANDAINRILYRGQQTITLGQLLRLRELDEAHNR